MRLRLLAPAVAACCVLAACTGETSGPPAAGPTGQPKPTAQPTNECPVPPPSKETWPREVPPIVPMAPGLKIEKVDRSKGNVVQVRATVPMSISDSVRYLVREFPKAGFTLGRGDAERSEVDAPFQRGEALRGLVRVFALPNQLCQTLWLYAVVQNTNAPYDISYTPPPSSTPLPFG